MNAGTGAVLTIGVLFSLPMIFRAIGVWTNKLSANKDATALSGHYRHWKLTRATGRVVSSAGHTETHGGGYSGSGVYTVSSEYHNTFRLLCAGGQQIPVEIVNFRADVNAGDTVSVYWAKKRKKYWVMAVLNHTTGAEYFNDQEIFKVTAPRHWMLIIEMVAFTFLSCGLSLIPMFIFIWGQKRQFKRFKKHGVAAMWRRGQAEAQALT